MNNTEPSTKVINALFKKEETYEVVEGIISKAGSKIPLAKTSDISKEELEKLGFRVIQSI